MKQISLSTKKMLIKAGWFEGRSIDTNKYEKALWEAGYPTPSVVFEFLQEVGGLIIKHPHFRVPDKYYEFHFDVERAISGIYRENVKELEEVIGEDLTVIGEAFNEYMVLMMTRDGMLFAAYDDFLVFVGLTGIESIEAICQGKELPEVC